MKKKVFFTIALVGVLLVCIGACVSVYCFRSPKRVYETNWEITLPKKMHQDFYTSTEPSVHGDGIKFSVYSSKNGLSKDFLSDFKTESAKDSQEEILAKLAELKVPSEHYPDFEHQCSAKIIEKYSNKLYLIYDAETNKLYVVQDMQ